LKLLLIVACTGIAGYLVFRLLVYLGRPLYLQNALKEVEEAYTTLLRLAERDLESAIERYQDCRSENPPFPASEEERLEQVNSARRARDHEREINDNFLRLRIRFPNDFKKLAESAAAYRAYLRLRLYKEEFAPASVLDGTVADVSPEERAAGHQLQYEEARRLVIALEESLKRVEALLA
jgi:hypothetical protein